MKALIVNDDGIDSPGLTVLARVAVEAGLDVSVAAPHLERSGASASLSALEEDGTLSMSRRALPGFPDIEAFAVECSPALISFLAAEGVFGPPPDILLSGINLGPNTGHAILHSGTVGAALTAASHGARAVALSLDGTTPSRWETAESVAARAVRWATDHAPAGQVLNVNIPDIPLEELQGLRTAPLAEFGAVQAEIGEVREDGRQARSVAVTFRSVVIDETRESDAALLHRGWATATMLTMPFEVSGTDLSALTFSAA
ncbi:MULTISPECIES: 5'/3'-nucleotidase SurE [unclassified Rhodococcus (in: high G+C Gram-positive bacteria)]|uniref:5'/3'-nucleotidase SurE n=1 Tax=Rhodococcus sp. SJ-3 TaxID=3454628 RepID=UPI003F79CFE4